MRRVKYKVRGPPQYTQMEVSRLMGGRRTHIINVCIHNTVKMRTNQLLSRFIIATYYIDSQRLF